MKNGHSPHPPTPSSLRYLLSDLLPALFLAFRLVYIPASVLSHTGHGLPYLNTALILSATFGMEYLTLRSGQKTVPAHRQREVWFVVVALLVLGLFPEEAPTSAILWAAVGAVWGRLWAGGENREKKGTQISQNLSAFISVYQWFSPQWFSPQWFSPQWFSPQWLSSKWLGLLAGSLLGLTGLFGPGSWLMAGVLALWGWGKEA